MVDVLKTVNDFKDSFGSIFGLGGTKPNKGGTDALFLPKTAASLRGSLEPKWKNWTGNAQHQGKALQYGFAIVPGSFISPNSLIESVGAGAKKYATQVVGSAMSKIPGMDALGSSDFSPYYLDIPPQSITQKEIFANNIQATRKGIVVETEGVVFKDIIIEGTTGVFPGKRGEYSGARFNKNILEAPETGGVTSDGQSTAASVTTYTGYEEFLRLRQYFLSYAQSKVEKDGDLFLIFINQKDSQSLIVEPMEFTMLRSAKNPMAYNYRIVLKCIGTLESMYSSGVEDPSDYLKILQGIVNISANVSAGIQQGRAVMNGSRAVLESLSQTVGKLVLNPLRQVQFGMEDLSYGVSTVLSLPTNLVGNVNSALLDIRESGSAVSQAWKATNAQKQSTSTQVGVTTPAKGLAKPTTITPEDQLTEQEVLNSINVANRYALPREFIENLKKEIRIVEDNLADSLNLGSTYYDAIQNRTQTVTVSPLVTPTDDQLLLLNAMRNSEMALNLILATNGAFEANINDVFAKQTELFKGITTFIPPANVAQIVIQQGDTLEKIAARYYGNPAKWIDLVIINNLKPPFISDTPSERVKTYGDTLLVGV